MYSMPENRCVNSVKSAFGIQKHQLATYSSYLSILDQIKSFDHWPKNDVNKYLLAEAGFFYKRKLLI